MGSGQRAGNGKQRAGVRRSSASPRPQLAGIMRF